MEPVPVVNTTARFITTRVFARHFLIREDGKTVPNDGCCKECRLETSPIKKRFTNVPIQLYESTYQSVVIALQKIMCHLRNPDSESDPVEEEDIEGLDNLAEKKVHEWIQKRRFQLDRRRRPGRMSQQQRLIPSQNEMPLAAERSTMHSVTLFKLLLQQRLREKEAVPPPSPMQEFNFATINLDLFEQMISSK